METEITSSVAAMGNNHSYSISKRFDQTHMQHERQIGVTRRGSRRAVTNQAPEEGEKFKETGRDIHYLELGFFLYSVF